MAGETHNAGLAALLHPQRSRIEAVLDHACNADRQRQQISRKRLACYVGVYVVVVCRRQKHVQMVRPPESLAWR